MDIQSVGQLQSKSIQRRYFFDIEIRQQTEQLILDFAQRINYTNIQLEWCNIGDEADIHESGVALRVNGHYEIRYMLVSETFLFWYYDHVDSKIILEEVEDACDIEHVLCELFKCLVEEAGKLVVLAFMEERHAELPQYPDEPTKQRVTLNEKEINKFLRR